MDPDNQNFPETSQLKSVTIRKNGSSFQIFPVNTLGVEILDSISFEENIKSLTMGGNLYVKDLYNWSGELNVHSFEKVEVEYYIKIDSGTSKSKKRLELKKIDFNVISVSQITRKESTILDGEQNQQFIRIDFTTETPLVDVLEKNIVNFDGDFVGYIATDGSGEIPGLINEVFSKLQIEEYEIEPTYNGVWIRQNEISYPWAKSKGQSKLEQLLYYITNYAVSKNNANAVNYYLWRDTDGYHFKSIDSIVKEQKGTELENLYFGNVEENNNLILSTISMNESDVLALAKNNAFQAFYERVSPNYDDFYLDFVDTSLSFKKEIVEYNYHQDFNTWESIDEYKIIPDNQDTSNKTPDNLKYIQSLKVDDSIYGYFEEAFQNTPYYQNWDYIGASGDSRWNNIAYVPQYNITELNLETFYKIHKKIREPLKQKRAKYAHMKNLKRKWEVYRCSICCLSDVLGGTADQLDIQRLQGIENPNENPEYLALFGVTGIFAESDQEYKIVAAGAFTDVYNYDIGVTSNNGITLSYNLNSEPYNQTIKEFYNFAETFDNYEKYIFDHGFKTYDIAISKNNGLIGILDEFLDSVDNYIALADQYFSETIVQVPPNEQEFYTEFTRSTAKNNTLRIPPVAPDGFRRLFGNEVPPYPDWAYECSKLKFNVFNVSYQFEDETSNFRRAYNYSIFDYFSRYTIGENYIPYFDFADGDYEKIIELIDKQQAICEECLEPITLEIKKRKAEKFKVILQQQNLMLEYIKNTLQTTFYQQWSVAKEAYLNRKAFFISKKTQKFENNIEIKTPNNLFNIKSIKRLPVRGSRYEILARNKGITGAEIGGYLYEIFFNDDSERLNTLDGDHPYYDQKYKIDFGPASFKSELALRRMKIVDDVIPENDPVFSSQYPPKTFLNNSKLAGFMNLVDGAERNNQVKDYFYSDGILRNIEIQYPNENLSEYPLRYNLYNEELTFKKPPNIKREEISSYVRIEFKTPIGLESIVDFPDGFVRTAGYEYFLPYLVSLSSGPNGRQTINQNVVVIGMDPYGFDVAIKRIQDPKQDGAHYWWSSGIESSQMDLWPEIAFETEYTYYSCKSPSEPTNTGYEYSEFYNLDYDLGIKARTGEPLNISDNILYSNKASGYSHDLTNTNFASNYLFDVNKVTKVFRNWWSFHIPQNLIIIPPFESIFYDINYSYYDLTNKGLETSYTQILDIKAKNPRYYYIYYSDYSYNLSNSYSYNNIDLDYAQPDSSEILIPFDSVGVTYFIPNSFFDQKVSVFKDNTQFKQIHPELKAYFQNITNWWLSGDNIVYRPGIIEDDVWKYDLSGYTEYGMSFAPTTKNHPDIFDNNFAGQFIVFSRQATSSAACGKTDLKCINPKGFNTTANCPPEDPYCNCPARNRQPTEAEPSYLSLYKMEQEIKECVLIEQELGEEWLGCIWSDPNNTASCNCPEIGDKFMDYLEYSRTYATFWNTPKKTPLLRQAQTELLESQTIQVVIERNDAIKIGNLVKIQDTNPDGYKNTYNRYYGNWLVTSIINSFLPGKTPTTIVKLKRDSFSVNPNDASNPETFNKLS